MATDAVSCASSPVAVPAALVWPAVRKVQSFPGMTASTAMNGQKSAQEVRTLFEGRQETALVDHDLPPETFPSPISQARPLYPFDMRQRNLEGSATVEFIVDKNGHVTEAVPIAATNPGFNKEAVLCVKKWIFRPATREGINVCSIMRVEILFSLKPL